jgi:hypothetical protein
MYIDSEVKVKVREKIQVWFPNAAAEEFFDIEAKLRVKKKRKHFPLWTSALPDSANYATVKKRGEY